MRLWIAVFLHCLPLDALRPRWSHEDEAFAVLDQERVLALTPAARRTGIKLDMRRAGASAIAPEVVLRDRQPHLETEAQLGAALALLQYTPEVTLSGTDTILMSVGASLMAFGGPLALGRRAASTLQALDLHASVGMAPTAGGAWLLAHHAAKRTQRRTLRLSTLARRLDTLPLRLLPEAQARQDWLQNIGCRTLGELRALPRAGLQRRSSTELLHALDAAYGLKPELYAWLEAPNQFSRRIELNDYVEHTDAVLAVARRLAEQLSGWLIARQLAVRRVVLQLEHERGRHARPPTELELALAQPAWQTTHLLNLLREKLSRLSLQAPVIAVALHAPDTVEQPAVSTTLFPEPGGTAADHARLLDLLGARLGAQRVRHAHPAADHRPEAANCWGNANEPEVRPPVLPMLLDRPFWLLDPPLALNVVGNRPQYAGQGLRLMRGPERIESGWWDFPLTVRDYFVAEDEAAARYWIYRERDAEHARWFLHGLYA